MSRHAWRITAFLLAAFAGAWLIWGVAWLLDAFDTSSSGQLFVAVGAFSPAIASIVVRRLSGEGFGDAGLRLKFRRHARYYLVAWLLPLPVLGVVIVVAVALGLPVAHRDVSLAPVLTALVATLLATPLFFGEEMGWRGYLQIRLFAGRRPLLAAVITGLVWGVFHLPVILAGFEGYENIALGVAVFPVFTVLLSVIFGWLRERADSIWVTCLAHSASNFTGGALSAYLFVGTGSFILTSFAGVIAWVPLGVICAWIVLTGRLVPVVAPPTAALQDTAELSAAPAN